MKYPILLGLFFMALTSGLKAQEQEPESDTPLTLSEQFQSLITPKNSLYRNRGVRYRTIKERDLLAFKQVIIDSLNEASTKTKTLGSLLDTEINKTDSVKNLYDSIVLNNTRLKKEKDSIAFLGIPTTKKSYRVISWALILSLLGGLLFFIYKFRSSNFLTQQAKSALAEMEQEFEQHRRWALDREQKLSRELLDERNNKKKK